jgi:hypothetical protein
MKTLQPTIHELYLVCATALVALPTARKYFRTREPMRAAMMERIEQALRELGKEHLRRARRAAAK